MFEIKSQVEFDMAHYLSGYKGKCSNIHGHRYKLIVVLKADSLHKEGQLRGMVDDFTNFKACLKDVAEEFDHKLLLEDNDEGKVIYSKLKEIPNDFHVVFVPYRTTVEEMSRDIFNRIKAKGLPVSKVELYETDINSCTYTEE